MVRRWALPMRECWLIVGATILTLTGPRLVHARAFCLLYAYNTLRTYADYMQSMMFDYMKSANVLRPQGGLNRI